MIFHIAPLPAWAGMLSANSLISGRHVFTPEGEGGLPPSPASPKEPLPSSTEDVSTGLPPITLLWGKLHAITSISSLIPKGLDFSQESLTGKKDPKGVPVKRRPTTLTMLKRMLLAILSWQRLLGSKKAAKNSPLPVKGLPKVEWPSSSLVQSLINETIVWFVLLLKTVPAYNACPQEYLDKLLDDAILSRAQARARAFFTKTAQRNPRDGDRAYIVKNQLASYADEDRAAKAALTKL